MKTKIDKDAVQAFLDIYAKTCLNSTDSECDWRTDAKARWLMQAIADGKDLSGMDLSGINLKNAVINGAKLKGANLSGALLYNTTIENSDLSDCDLSGAHMEKTSFYNSDLQDLKLDLVFAKELNAEDCLLDEETRKKLTALNLLTEKIMNGEIHLKDLSWSDLLCVDFSKLDLKDIDLTDVDLSCLDLTKLNLKGTYIDPKQLRSLEGLLRYHHIIRNKEIQQQATARMKQLLVEKKRNFERQATAATVSPTKVAGTINTFAGLERRRD